MQQVEEAVDLDLPVLVERHPGDHVPERHTEQQGKAER